MEKTAEFRQFLEQHRGERHIIVLHDTPDPDAIASAYAHRMLSGEFGIETVLMYRGKARQQRNIALMKVLGVDLQKYEAGEDLSGFQGAVLVDNQGSNCNQILQALEDADIAVLATIDHHEVNDRFQPEFYDVRRTGATASIYSSYLENGLIELDKARREHVVAATGLLYAVLTDTMNFVTAHSEDYSAAAFLSRFRDADLLVSIMNQARSKYVMDIIRRALGDREIVESYSVAGIGYLRAVDRDAIAQAAEFLLSEENVHTVIVYGIMQDNDEETLVGTFRTTKITLSPEEFLRDIFGPSLEESNNPEENLAAGTFAIPVGFLGSDSNNERLQDMKWKVFDAQLKFKIFSRIGVSRERLEELTQ